MIAEGPPPLADPAGEHLPRRGRQDFSRRPPAMVMVPAVLVGLAMLLPIAYLAIRGAGATTEAWELLFRVRTLQIIGRTTLLVVVVTGFSILLAVPLAWLTSRTDLPFRRVWSVLTAMPLVVPTFVGAFLFISVLGPRGVLQQALEPLGVDRLPAIYGLPGAALVLILLSYPYILLTVKGAFQGLDPALEESARTLGHGRMSTAFRVTLPQLRPAIISGSLLVALYTLSDFGAVSLMRFPTFTWVIYQQYQTAFDRSIAGVLSLALVGMALAIVLIDSYTRGRIRYHRTGSGASRKAEVVRLGRWRWPALAFAGFVVVMALGIPAGVLLHWLVRGLLVGEPLLLLWSATVNSLVVSGAAAFVAAVCSIPVAVMVVRHPGRLSNVIERMSFTGFALPGIVVALALVFFAVNYARPVYQTAWLLVFAYVVLFLPAAMGATRAALLKVSPSLEDAARGLGRGPLQTMRTVTAPLIVPGILMGAALVFLIAMKELPATLILGPLGFKTLATAVWSASTEAFFAQAAAPALLLIVISSLPMAFLVTRDFGESTSSGSDYS
ncbi:MAG: iron ABC transporter permease [Chloroflexi bacterium]|nr:iron ABC transporter permease [Chloroflexota bacterium]